MTPAVSLPVSGKSIFNKRHIFVAQRVGYYEVVLSVTEGAKTALGWWSRPTCTTPVYAVVLTRPWTDSRWAGTWRTRWETWNSLHTNGKAPSVWNTACCCWQRRAPGNGGISRRFRVGKHSKSAAGNAFISWHPWRTLNIVSVYAGDVGLVWCLDPVYGKCWWSYPLAPFKITKNCHITQQLKRYTLHW
jgi:hypothetical protein